MLNDADGHGGGEAGEAVKDAGALFRRLKRDVKADYNSKGQVNWRREAREDFDFEAGEQLDENDKAILQDAKRPIVIFNRVGTTVDCVAGQEVGNRQEVHFLPRRQGVVKKNELLTSAAKWFRQQCDAEDEESDAFRDLVVCGMGWTETRLDYDDNPEGDPKVDRTDPLEMGWDRGAKKRNLADARRVFHIRRDVPIEEARALCPGDEKAPFDDSDYHAAWIGEDGEGEKANHNDGETYDDDAKNGEDEGDRDEKAVTLVRVQWWERTPAYMVVDPFNPDSILTLDKEKFEDLGQKAKLAGGKLRFTKTTRKVYRQAYLGNVLLEVGDAPYKGHFSFKCMTGKRDRNKNTFFGIVRAMKDPARWSNKWMSQTMHIMNTTAKGGIAVEQGQFFANDADGEASWAHQDQVTKLKPGALSGTNPKWIAKPTSQFPQGSFELMQYAVQSHRDVSGVNVDMLGAQTSAGQAASLDLQRKQSALTILQPLFDGLRRYRKEQGRLMLCIIEFYIPDGTLVKIEGPEDAEFVPLIKKEAFDGKTQYDVIVDQNATSANQKELTWAMLQQILPVIGKMLPPATWLALLKYSPLPTSAQKDISDSIAKSQQEPDPEQAKRDAELKVENDKAQAAIVNNKALSDAKIQTMRDEAANKAQLAREAAQNDAMLKALTAPPAVDPVTGQAVQGGGGGDMAALVMGMLQEMRRDMTTLAQALNAPKKLIRDPQSGEIVGIAPMGAG